MPQYGSITDEDLAHLVQRISDASGALLRGDIGGYPSLIDHAGGPHAHGPLRRGANARLRCLTRAPGGDGALLPIGEGEVEPVRCHASCDLAVLAAIERQRAEVGGLREQDWSLRFTLAFCRKGPLANELASRRPKM